MLVVRVELWPGGNPRLVQNLGMMTIVNETPIGMIPPDLSPYDVHVDGESIGKIEAHRSKGPWSVTFLALKKYFDGR